MIEKFFVEQGRKKVELDRYLSKELDKAGFTKSEIVKTPLVTRIVVNVTRPGLAIGKSGSNISQLTETIGKKFKIDNPQLEIKEIENPNLDAKAVANRMRASIERGFAWRSVVFKTMMDIRAAGALGIEIFVSGKITGKAGRKKKLRYFHGYVKKIGEQARLVDYAKTTAYPKVGAIGIKVRLIRPGTKFPDKVKISDYIKASDYAKAAESEEEKEAAAVAADGAAAEAETETGAGTKERAAKKNAMVAKNESGARKEKHEAKKEHAGKAADGKERKERLARERKGKAQGVAKESKGDKVGADAGVAEGQK